MLNLEKLFSDRVGGSSYVGNWERFNHLEYRTNSFVLKNIKKFKEERKKERKKARNIYTTFAQFKSVSILLCWTGKNRFFVKRETNLKLFNWKKKRHI